MEGRVLEEGLHQLYVRVHVVVEHGRRRGRSRVRQRLAATLLRK